MATYYTLLTKTGQARIANAVALNQMVNLTYMAVGDGNGNPTTPNENQTALVREKYRATINQLTVDADNPNYLVAELIIPTNVGGWSIYEVGVFDDQNQLIAVANFPATYKPELAEGSGRDLIVRIVIQVSNTSVVTLKIDPAITLASQAWVAANYVKKITMAGGTTGQVLAKNSNANEDFKWVDPAAAVNVIVDSQTEEQTLASGQTIINLAKLTTQATAIYVEGVRLYPTTHYTVNSDTRLTLKTSYPNGSKILAVQNDPTSTIALASLTQKGFTILSSTPGDDETKAATPKAVQSVSPGRLLNVQVFYSSGTYNPTPGTKKVIVEMVGGGGGGAGAHAADSNSIAVGGPGGAGSYAKAQFTSGFSGVNVIVGSGGMGGTTSNPYASTGGTSSFGNLVSATGGDSGKPAGPSSSFPFSTVAATVSAGVSGSGVIVGTPGEGASSSIALSPGVSVSSAGGSSHFGAGGFITAYGAKGIDGAGHGAGGGPVATSTGTPNTPLAGGNGSSGIVIIWEYA